MRLIGLLLLLAAAPALYARTAPEIPADPRLEDARQILLRPSLEDLGLWKRPRSGKRPQSRAARADGTPKPAEAADDGGRAVVQALLASLDSLRSAGDDPSAPDVLSAAVLDRLDDLLAYREGWLRDSEKRRRPADRARSICMRYTSWYGHRDHGPHGVEQKLRELGGASGAQLGNWLLADADRIRQIIPYLDRSIAAREKLRQAQRILTDRLERALTTGASTAALNALLKEWDDLVAAQWRLDRKLLGWARQALNATERTALVLRLRNTITRPVLASARS